MAPITAQVVELADGRATHLHPGLQPLHLVVNVTHDGCDVLAPTACGDPHLPRLRVAYVIEVYAVDVIVARDLLADVGQVGGGAWVLGVHVAVGANLLDEARVFRVQLPASQLVPFAHGQRHHPCVQLHATAVTFAYGKFQGVVAGTCAREPTQATIPRLVGRWVDDGSADTCLYEHRVDARLGILVE